jgi:hypothetical protein
MMTAGFFNGYSAGWPNLRRFSESDYFREKRGSASRKSKIKLKEGLPTEAFK